jgi:hypothetical protein
MTSTSAAEPNRTVKTTLPARAYQGSAGPGSLSIFLGLFSVGLGLAETLCPRQMSALTGVRSTALLRGYGLRELFNGLALLKSDGPAFWLWGRVGGDAVDLATLAAAYADAPPADREKLLISAAAVLGVTALDVMCAVQHSRRIA